MAIPNNYSEFEETLLQEAPPSTWSEALRAMWFDVKGDWEASHNIAQDLHDNNGSWIHAYLHRKEGDKFNSGYWYRMAGRRFPSISLEDEQRELIEYFLDQ
ncbi:hypothetical protein [Arenibacter certesii]|uniref:Uncharacterized protein n=1 Tax=Arenibacter certesii TaxID=228955 RepID=A0A918MPL0_9FLAO|nr:hypothetical protein [Arenibacter certesii]GGW43068.1 hypothetical protein GCM10007383_29560 [Arenibacter certesii]